MILNAFLLLTALCAGLAVFRWRWGMFLMLLVGMLEDPVRKMVPGVPGYLVLAAGVVWLASALGAMLAGDVQWRSFRGYYPALSAAIVAFAVLLVPAAIRSATYGPGSWQITLIGLFVYGSLLLGMMVGEMYPTTAADIRRLMSAYVVLSSIMVVGAVAERMGVSHMSIGSQAMGHTWVTYRTGGAVHMLSGFFRGPDVLGWHAATLTMLAVSLALYEPGIRRWLWVAAAAWGGVGVMLCARRKMLTMLPVYASILLVMHLRHGRLKYMGPMLVVALLASAGGLQLYRTVGADREVEAFYGTTLSELDDSLAKHGVSAVITTYRQAGFFGYGVGMATQGTHHIAVDRPRAWQESGPSKLVAELGIPGLLGFLILGFTLLRSLVHDLRVASGFRLYALFAGLSATVLANGAAGVVSAQIFGDPFVAALLSLFIGIILSAARLRHATMGSPTHVRRPATAPPPAPAPGGTP